MHTMELLVWFGCLLITLSVVHSEHTQSVLVPSEGNCSGSEREISAVNITSSMYGAAESCRLNLLGDKEHLLVIINTLKLSCGQYIRLYYDSDVSGSADEVFDCHTQRYEIKDPIYIPGRKLNFVFERGSEEPHSFNFMISSYKKSFFCDSQFDCFVSGQDICIDEDLECDGAINCPNGQDEKFCPDTTEPVSPMAVGVVITIIIVLILTCIGCIVGIVCCCQKRGRVNRRGHVFRGVQQPVMEHPPVCYPTGPQAPPGGYQPIPTSAPGGSYPQMAYNPNYAPAQPIYQNQSASYPTQGAPYPAPTSPPESPYPIQGAPYPSQGASSGAGPPPPYNPEILDSNVPL